MTETAMFADVVLPASAWPEKDGTVTNTNRQVQMGRLALPMPGDSRQDWWIVQEIARRIGLDWDYTGPADIYEEMRECMDSIRGISWERLSRESAVTYPCASEDDPGRPIIFGDGYPTPSGRGKFVPAGIVPPDEKPDDDYPTILTTGRVLEHWHTGAITRRASVLDTIEPEAVCHMAPRDLRDLGARGGRPCTCLDPARDDRARGPRRPRRAARDRLRPLRLRGGRGEPVDQPGARPVREDPRVQVLRGEGGEGRGGPRGRVAVMLGSARPECSSAWCLRRRVPCGAGEGRDGGRITAAPRPDAPLPPGLRGC